MEATYILPRFLAMEFANMAEQVPVTIEGRRGLDHCRDCCRICPTQRSRKGRTSRFDPACSRLSYRPCRGVFSSRGCGPDAAVPIKKSVTPEFIICLEDGKKFKSLKRHIGSAHNLTPQRYRAKWGLPYDYPMVASAYAATCSALAKSLGLGQLRKGKRAAATNRAMTFARKGSVKKAVVAGKSGPNR